MTARLKFLFVLCVSLLLFFFKTGKAIASDDFFIQSTSTYVVGVEGRTAVQHQISLTNKKLNIFATQYALSVASTRISNVWAKDGIASLTPNVTKTANATNISIDFKQKAVGEGQTLTFFIGYEDDDITQKIGRVREMNIPRPEDIQTYEQYTIKLIVPNEFEAPVQIIPQASTVTHGVNTTLYTFNRDTIFDRGVTALFGEHQFFSFDLRYSLQNTTPIARTMEIALPPDTANQTMIYDAITPLPDNMKVDNDGNWIAEYKVDPREQMEIHAAGSVIISLLPNEKVFQDFSNLDEYTRSQSLWPTDDPEIKRLAKELKTAENIYNFVVDHLSYNTNRIDAQAKRLGAKQAYEQPDQAICMEFTDLFIAIARAAGIPARELNGFAYTQNPDLRPLSLRQDILHAWPEYYDQQQQRWIQIDPTWGNTTQGIDYFSRFDLNHFVFVIHGTDAQAPYPAGFYKAEGFEGKDIEIVPTDRDPKIIDQLQLAINLPDQITAGFTNRSTITIQNHGNTALQNGKVEVRTTGFDILTPTVYNINVLLPYTEVELPVIVKGSSFFDTKIGSIRVESGKYADEKQIKIKATTTTIPTIITTMAVGAAFAVIATRPRRIFFSLKKRFHSLRRKSK